MFDLKYQTVHELIISKGITEERISSLKSQLIGQQERLKWINKYLFQKTPQEMTVDEIELKLVHRVIIK